MLTLSIISGAAIGWFIITLVRIALKITTGNK